MELHDIFTAERLIIGGCSLVFILVLRTVLNWILPSPHPLSEITKHLLALLDKTELWTTGNNYNYSIFTKKAKGHRIAIYDLQFPPNIAIYHDEDGIDYAKNLSSYERSLIRSKTKKTAKLLKEKSKKDRENRFLGSIKQLQFFSITQADAANNGS